MEKCIDVSRHQTDFNALRCKTAGVETVICRLAYGSNIDTKLLSYAKKVKDVGMKLGGYGFGTWHYKNQCNGNLNVARSIMRMQVQSWINYAKEVGVNDWFAIDQELEGGNEMGLSIGDNTDLLVEASNMIKEAGLSPCLYASVSWIMSNVSLETFTCPLWIAYYKWYGSKKSFDDVPETFPTSGSYGTWMSKYKDRICLWQFTSEGYADVYGCVHGSNNLDKNFLYFHPVDGQSNVVNKNNYSVVVNNVTRLPNGDVCFAWPVADHRITAGWTYSDGSSHGALDFGVPTGTPVFAVEDGVVDYVYHWNGKVTKGDTNSYGNFVRIRHADYSGKSLRTLYAHLNIITVANYQSVKTGQLIGYSGQTGNCTGPHLHYEVQWGGVGSAYRKNPLNWTDNDFYKAYNYVRLGAYTSVIRPSIEEAKQEVNVKTDVANNTSEYFKIYSGTSGSIVTALKSIGEESSYDYRCKIANANNISGYKGTSAQNTNMLGLLKNGKLIKPSSIEMFPAYVGDSLSIITALKSVGYDSSYTYRERIAAANGIKDYKGSSAQNICMVELIKKGKLVKPK